MLKLEIFEVDDSSNNEHEISKRDISDTVTVLILVAIKNISPPKYYK